jgi:toxoflavin synthase
MSTDYDLIAESYKRSKQVSWRYHIEQYSLCRLLGSLSGSSVLDLACGDGHYTRLVRRMGAVRVVGADLSRRMIDLATAAERQDRIGVEYIVADARTVQFTCRFDVVLAAYLLNYARSPEDVLEMAHAIVSNLKPGGRFIAINNNPGQRASTFQATRKYGFVKSADGQIRNGTPIRYTFFQEGEVFEVENYHLDTEIYASALKRAGLSQVHWHAPTLSPEEDVNRGDWADFLRDPPIVFLTCKRKAERHMRAGQG